jgi:hypothetical protein
MLRLSLFGLRDFRCLVAGMVVGSAGMMGETVALGWLALTLTDSPFLVGVAMGARALPLFFAGVPAGVLADRFPRQRLLLATSAGQALTAAAIGALALSGRAGLVPVLVLTLAAGTLRAVEHAARQSYAHDVVGAAGLVHALAVLGVAMRGGWLAGSLGAGLLIAHGGSGAAYLGVAVANLAAAAAYLPASAGARPAAGARDSLWQGIVDFAGVVRRDRLLLALMALTGGAEVLGFSHQTLLPSLARDVLRAGPEALGLLNAARAVGGILGLAVAMRGWIAGRGAAFLGVLLLFGLSLVGLGAAPAAVGLGGVVLLLVAANAAGALADLLAQSLLQFGVPARLRGRAGGAWVVAIGLAPLGQLQIGALASLFGVSAALAASGLALAALVAATAAGFPRLRRL